MKIRNIRKEDKAELFEMIDDFYRNSGACLHPINWRHCESTFQMCLTKNPYARMMIIEDEENQTEGFCLLSFTWSNEAGGMVVLLEELYFKPSARGKGYGKRMMEFIEKEYPEACRFRLEVTRDNEGAIGLYRKFGYEELDYYQMVKEKN